MAGVSGAKPRVGIEDSHALRYRVVTNILKRIEGAGEFTHDFAIFILKLKIKHSIFGGCLLGYERKINQPMKHASLSELEWGT
jgi:hypothetical protein